MTVANAHPSKEQLLDEFNAIVSETEHLLKSVGSEGGNAAADAENGSDTALDQNLKAARERLALLEETVIQRAKAAAQATDAYVHRHPWQAVGFAAGIGVGLGLMLGLLLRRR